MSFLMRRQCQRFTVSNFFNITPGDRIPACHTISKSGRLREQFNNISVRIRTRNREEFESQLLITVFGDLLLRDFLYVNNFL